MESKLVIEEEDSKESKYRVDSKKCYINRHKITIQIWGITPIPLLFVRIAKKNTFQKLWVKFKDLSVMILNKTNTTKNSWSKKKQRCKRKQNRVRYLTIKN